MSYVIDGIVDLSIYNESGEPETDSLEHGASSHWVVPCPPMLATTNHKGEKLWGVEPVD